MTLREATEKAMKTSYAIESVGSEINEADAGAFFLEGFEYCSKLAREKLYLMVKDRIDNINSFFVGTTESEKAGHGYYYSLEGIRALNELIKELGYPEYGF